MARVIVLLVACVLLAGCGGDNSVAINGGEGLQVFGDVAVQPAQTGAMALPTPAPTAGPVQPISDYY